MDAKNSIPHRPTPCCQRAPAVPSDVRACAADLAPVCRALGDATRLQIIQSLASASSVRVVEPDTVAALTLAGFSSQVTAKKDETIGTATEALCLVRVPGESTNRSAGTAGCETANTLARGSDAAQVVAEAFLAGSLAADVAIQNAGGVRIPVPSGTLSMNTAFTLLPFTNVLVEMSLTGEQIIAALEDGVANYDASSSTGSSPSVAARIAAVAAPAGAPAVVTRRASGGTYRW